MPLIDFPAITREEYDADRRLNWSRLKHLGRSPAHYQHALKHGAQAFADTDAKLTGRVFHTAALEPAIVEQAYAVWPDRRIGKAWEAFEAAAKREGRETIRTVDYERALNLAVAVRSHRPALDLLNQPGQAEATVRWIAKSPPIAPALADSFPPYAFECKGRLDFATADTVIDLKSSLDASPDGFGREAARLGYVTQAAWYLDGIEAAYGRRLGYVLIVVEKTAPYVVQVYRVTDEQLELGRQTYRDLLDRLWLCERTGHWPAYAESGELPLTLPRWATPAFDDEGADDLGLTFGAGQLSES